MKVIKVRQGYIKKISEHTGIGRNTVSKALRGLKDSDHGDRARKAAIKEFKGKYEKSK